MRAVHQGDDLVHGTDRPVHPDRGDEMPRLKVTATCTATVTEEWIVDITDEEYADLLVDETTRQPSVVPGMTETEDNLRDDLIDIGTYVNVENVQVEHEREREIVGFELVEPDFTNDKPSVGLTS